MPKFTRKTIRNQSVKMDRDLLSSFQILMPNPYSFLKLISIICMSIFAFVNVAYGQFFPEEENDSNITSIISGEEKNFTAPKFGLKMNYPSDWTFIPTAPEFQEFTPGIYDYSAMLPSGQASVGKFCASLGINPESYDCELESPAYLKIDVFRLKDGTTLKEFYEGKIKSAEAFKDLGGVRKYIQTNKTNISGLSAIETISTSGKGSIDRLLDKLGQTNPASKYITIYFVNGSTGYTIFSAWKLSFSLNM